MDPNFKAELKEINSLAQRIKKDINIMEVCGTHTQAIAHFGIREVLPKNIRLITGPGCPVCVTDQEDIDNIVQLALAGIPVASYGDVIRVPGNKMSLDQAKAKGARVYPVYSIEEALKIKEKEPDLVFFAFGFETTTPMTAYAVKRGLTIYCSHKLFLPVFKVLLESGEIKIDGFLGPGHVSVITGVDAYNDFKDISLVIAGFEAIDVLLAIKMLLEQIGKGEHKIENEYIRAVSQEGNKKAMESIFEVFDISDALWRGFGIIKDTGLELRKEYQDFDAKIKYKDILAQKQVLDNKLLAACQCGQVIKGVISPSQCPLYGKACTPDLPKGPCMVSYEGACQVSFKYNK